MGNTCVLVFLCKSKVCVGLRGTVEIEYNGAGRCILEGSDMLVLRKIG